MPLTIKTLVNNRQTSVYITSNLWNRHNFCTYIKQWKILSVWKVSVNPYVLYSGGWYDPFWILTKVKTHCRPKWVLQTINHNPKKLVIFWHNFSLFVFKNIEITNFTQFLLNKTCKAQCFKAKPKVANSVNLKTNCSFGIQSTRSQSCLYGRRHNHNQWELVVKIEFSKIFK